VVVDHTGADLLGMSAGGVARHRTVTGPEQFRIHKARLGAMAERRAQHAVKTGWERNAGEVAAAVAETAGANGAEILIVAGEPRSRALLIEHLPERWRSRVVAMDAGSRAPGADPARLDDVTIQAVAAQAADRVAAVTERFETQAGRDAAAATGLPAVVTALQRGQVDTLLLIDDPGSTDELWVGPEPLELSFDPAELRALGVREPHRVRADATTRQR
jgi:Bacterial archaeo-eukaryotic release factor family 2